MRPKNENANVLKNTIMLYVMTAAKFLLPFIVTGSLTRRLGTDIYGVVTYVTAAMNYFLLFFDFGFNYSATKQISQHRNDKERTQQILSLVLCAKVFLVIVGSVLLCAVIPFIQLLREHLLLTILYYLSTAANILIPDFLYRGLEKMEYVTIRFVISKLVATVLIVVLVTGPGKVLWIPICYLLGTLVAAGYTAQHVVKQLGYRITIPKIHDVWVELKDSAIYFASNFATTALSVFNTLIMGFVSFTTAEIAYWGVALQIVQAVQALYDPITTSVYPHVATKRNYGFVIKLTGVLSIGVLFGCVLLYFLAEYPVMILSGKECLDAIPLLRLLIPVIFLSFPAQMLGFPLLGALGQQKQVTISTITTAIVHVVIMMLVLGIGQLTVTNMAIIRDFSEALLLGIRVFFAIKLVNMLKNKQ